MIDCEFFIELPSIDGWQTGCCGIETIDRTFNAMTDCVKKTCRLHRGLGVVVSMNELQSALGSCPLK